MINVETNLCSALLCYNFTYRICLYF